VNRYNYKIVEEKWQKYWDDKKVFKAKIDKSKKNFIV
jgi:leucyl-tRNA synthetase